MWTNVAPEGKAEAWWSFWCLRGIQGFERPRLAEGGPQKAANEITRELRTLARKFLGKAAA
jgi:hypothetical protein